MYDEFSSWLCTPPKKRVSKSQSNTTEAMLYRIENETKYLTDCYEAKILFHTLLK